MASFLKSCAGGCGMMVRSMTPHGDIALCARCQPGWEADEKRKRDLETKAAKPASAPPASPSRTERGFRGR